MMARSMSNAAFSTCLGVYHIDMGCHVKLMPPRTYNFDMKLHVKFDMGSMSNGLTRNSMSKGLSERTGTILHRFHTGSPFKGCFQRFGMGEQAFTFLCVSLIFAQNDLRNENENRTHNNDNEKRKQHMETEKLTISTSKQTGHNKATH